MGFFGFFWVGFLMPTLIGLDLTDVGINSISFLPSLGSLVIWRASSLEVIRFKEWGGGEEGHDTLRRLRNTASSPRPLAVMVRPSSCRADRNISFSNSSILAFFYSQQHLKTVTQRENTLFGTISLCNYSDMPFYSLPTKGNFQDIIKRHGNNLRPIFYRRGGTLERNSWHVKFSSHIWPEIGGNK